MFNELKQFVPSRVCLSCDGCCRFGEPSSCWRPRVTFEEKMSAVLDAEARPRFSVNAVDAQNYITTMAVEDGHRCVQLSGEDNACQIYSQRPFECRLYPFMLVRDCGGIHLKVHLSCPYVQDHLDSDEFREYVVTLNHFFRERDVVHFIRRNQALLEEYADCRDEFHHLFSISFDESAPGVSTYLLKEKPLVERFIQDAPRRLSTFSFVSLASWSEHFYFHPEIIQNSLCVFATNILGAFLYLPPLGKTISREAVDCCFDLMETVNGGSGVSRIENVQEDQLAFFPEEEFIRYRKGYEYCYFRNDLIDLRGNAYKSKRSSYNHFIKNNSYQYLAYEEDMFEECVHLYDRWVRQRKEKYSDDIYAQMLEENRGVHQIIMKHGRELGLVGRVVQVDGKIQAYSFGYPLNGEYFCILTEVADLNIKGLSVYIFREFCADACMEKYKFVNVMDDFAMQNMEKVKMSFQPTHLVPAFTIEKRHPVNFRMSQHKS